MVRSVARSRGCETCRRRRVKCGEEVPKCRQCHRIGKSCPGPSSGIFILRMLPQVKAPRSESGARSNGKSKATRNNPLSQYQPSRALAFEQMFVSNFISSFAHPLLGDGRHQSWMQYLPTFLSGCDLIRPSIRAATLAYYAYCADDTAIEREADRWYMVALSRQRAWLSARYCPKEGTEDRDLIPTDQEICTSMMLLYFELIRPTAVASWMKHFSGACRLMELRKAINCQTDTSRLLLQSLRVLNVRHSIRFRTPSPLASIDWYKAIQTQGETGTADAILDILLALPTYFPPESNHFVEFGAVPSRVTTTVGEKSRLVELLARFDQYERRYLKELDESQALSKDSPAAKPRSSRSNGNKIQCPDNGGGDFCSFDVQMMLDSAMVIISSLVLLQHDAWSSAELLSFSDEQDLRSTSILQSADRTLKGNPKGLNPGACLQFVFPLEVVATFSCDAVKRDAAQHVLDRIGWARL